MKEQPVEAYPLCWPVGRPRATRHEHAAFKTAFGKARDACLGEIYLLGGRRAIISTNIPLKRDGLPYADSRSNVADTGVAVYFDYKKRQMCFACDRWWKAEDNMQAIAKTIAALRGVARWGTGDMMEAAFTGFAALPPPDAVQGRGWRQVLGLNGSATLEQAKDNYRRLSAVHHPDKPGGSHDAMSELNWAWAQAQAGLAP